MDNSLNFPCYKCGACCRQVNKANVEHNLDRGDGICRYFNEKTNLCDIYENRPDICRVDFMYKQHFSKIYNWNDFCEYNLKICEQLQKNI